MLEVTKRYSFRLNHPERDIYLQVDFYNESDWKEWETVLLKLDQFLHNEKKKFLGIPIPQ